MFFQNKKWREKDKTKWVCDSWLDTSSEQWGHARHLGLLRHLDADRVLGVCGIAAGALAGVAASCLQAECLCSQVLHAEG